MKHPRNCGTWACAYLVLGALTGCRATQLAECQDLAHAIADTSATAWNTPDDADLGSCLELAVTRTNAVVLVNPKLESARRDYTQALQQARKRYTQAQQARPKAPDQRELAKRTLGHETTEALGRISLVCSAER